MRIFIITLSLLLSAFTSLYAQGRPGGARGGGQGEAILRQLDLTPEQEADLKVIREETRQRLQTLRGESGQRPDRAALQAERERSEAAIRAVLTPEQQQEFDRLRAERKEQRQTGRENVDREALRAELKRHHEEEVKPILKAARGQLDKRISAEDQATIERLRQSIKQGRKEQQRGGRGDRSARGEHRNAFRSEHAGELAELDVLAEKYAADIAQLRERLAPEMASWEAERRAIMDRHRPEGTDARRTKPQRGDRQPQREDHFGPRFLLLRP